MGAMDSRAHAQLTRAAERILELVGHDENITGVGVGCRRRGGKLTDEPVVTVMVRKKRRPALVSRRRMIPAEVEVDGTSYATDVLQAQAVLMHADETPPRLRTRCRPLLFGCGVSNFSDARPDAGTLGAFVRDNTDGTMGILSANHVIADNNRAPGNDPIYQPAALDRRTEGNQVGRLKRFVTIAGRETAVDAAIAQVEEPEEVTEGEYRSAGPMEPPSENGKATGMLVVGDGFGNVWLTSMTTTLERLNVRLLPDLEGRNVEATAPAVGSKLEKVGRTTAYTVGRVLATGESVNVEVEGVGVVRYTNLIKVLWLGWNGDSGAMVGRKAGPERYREEIEVNERNSRERIREIIAERFETCEVLEAIQYAFEVPVTEDAELSDEARDEFLAMSDTGRYLITLTYLNTSLFRTRLERRVEAEKQAYAQAFYEEFRPVAAELMANPESTTRLTRQDGEDFVEMLAALTEAGVLTSEEEGAAVELCRLHEAAVVNRGRDELIEYMNRSETLLSVQTTARSMTALTRAGTARNMTCLD